MSDSSEPSWGMLPHDPMGFFELEPGFDRRALKRAYNRWLRRFKPEKYPAEFQRLRAAYEGLENRLRYFGSDADAAPRSMDERELADTLDVIAREPHARPRTPEDASPEDASPEDFAARLAERGPEAVFVELQEAHDKVAADFCRLAILSDIVEHPEAQSFGEWLIEGLQRWPNDHGLRALLYSYCRTRECAARATEILPLLARVGSPTLFGYLSEPLWLGLQRRLPFDQFAATYEKCRRLLDAAHHPASVLLGATVFRASLFRADENWLEHEWEMLSENESQVPDFELIEMLYEYRLVRESLLSDHPLHDPVDRALHALAAGDIAGADRAFLVLGVALGRQRAHLHEAFARGDDRWFPVVAALHIWEREIEARLDRAAPNIPQTESRFRVNKLLRKLDRLTHRTSVGLLRNLGCLANLLSLAIPVVALIYGWSWCIGGLESQVLGIAAFAGYTALVVGGYLMVVGALGRMMGWLTEAVYNKVWRPELVAFVIETGIRSQQLIDSIQTSRDDQNNRERVLSCMEQDPALEFAGFGSHVS